MQTLYIDANIVLNLWRKEIDPKTGRELWKGSGSILEKVERKDYRCIHYKGQKIKNESRESNNHKRARRTKLDPNESDRNLIVRILIIDGLNKSRWESPSTLH